MAMSECSRLVWDNFTGDVICVDSGVVVDKIYDYSPVYEKPETIERGRMELRRRRRNRSIDDVRRRLRRHLRLLSLARSITSRGFIIDYEKLLGNGKLVFTVYSRRSLRAVEWFRERGLLPVLDRIIGVLGDLEPRAVARTIRGRYILAYLVYELLHGRDPSYQQLDGLRELIGFNAFTKIKREALKIVMRYPHILKEVMEND